MKLFKIFAVQSIFKKFCKKKLQTRSFMFGNPKYDLQLARQTKNQKNFDRIAGNMNLNKINGLISRP